MEFINTYYYTKFSKNNIPLDKKLREKFEKKLQQEEFNIFLERTDNNYFIMSEHELIGFFSIKIKDCLEIHCLYIFEEYRNKNIGRGVINDIIFATRHNIKKDIKYVIANSFTDSVMFFLKNGFDFCKIDKKSKYKKKNMIKMYKKI